MRRTVLLVLALGMLGVGCPHSQRKPTEKPVTAPQPGSDVTSNLLGTGWVAVSIAGRPAADKMESWVKLSTDGEISGHAACNAFTGSFRIDGDRISVDQLARTKMLCVGATMDEERRFLAAIEGANRFEIVKDHLLLYPAGSGEPTELAPLSTNATGDAAISGNVLFDSHEDLQADARLVVRLVDLTMPDVPPDTLGATIIDPVLAPPIPFTIVYRSDAVDPDGSYALEATVLVGDDAMLDTHQPVPVLTGGHPRDDVQLEVAPTS